MRLRLAIVLCLAGAGFPARSHDVITTKVTWSREIARLVSRRCLSCHGAAGPAFSLATYQEARPWAKAMKEETLERRMPPWGAVKGFGSFRDDQGLTQEDLELISDWVEGGAPQGDPSLLPKPRPAVLTTASPAGRQLMIDGTLVLKAPVTLTAIKPKTVPDGTSVQVVAERPDGSVEPLLWLYRYQPRFHRAYVFETPLAFPAGTRLTCFPNAGLIAVTAK